MSLLSKFVSEHLLLAIESEFQSHSAELQSKLVDEVKLFADEVNSWIKNKIDALVHQKGE